MEEGVDAGLVDVEEITGERPVQVEDGGVDEDEDVDGR